MITLHSIDLKYVSDPCFAEMRNNGCRALSARTSKCGSYKCPFYKPKDCKDWVRVEERHYISVIPPEEYYKYRRGK